jgi:hypothetical protein
MLDSWLELYSTTGAFHAPLARSMQ